VRRLRLLQHGLETLCESQENMGYTMNDGFAEYAIGYEFDDMVALV
jgi:D-arabinose 1-dehydrogenase-like Zn-dependent alcohol dehydrogenase